MKKKTMSSSIYLSVIFAFIMTICCQSKKSVTFDCVPSEKNALMRFKASFSNNSFHNRLSSWKNNTECCTWKGVECDNAHVVGLHLRNRVVDEYVGYPGYVHYPSPDSRLRSDAIDSTLLELKYLIYLDLSGNDFQRSSIPTFLGSMKQLQYLDLSYANFSGIVPHQIGNLSSLTTLDLQQHEFPEYGLRVDDVTWAGNLSSLQYLDMSGVNLSRTKDVIKVLGMLPSLVDLRLSDTLLGDTSHPLTNCVNRSTLLFPNVQYLDLSSNFFFGENSSLCCFLQNMTSLSFLYLSSNSIHQKADWISDMLWDKCHLKSLDLGGNQFYGDISGAFRNLSGCWVYNLEIINFKRNEFNGHLPEELGELKQLTELDVSENNLSGQIPSSIGELKQLTELDVSENNLSGQIPSSIENLRALKSMHLFSNKLSGEIPISLGQLSNLERIDMNSSSFEDTLSEAHFANLSRLRYLNTGDNYKLKLRVGDDWAPPFQLETLMMNSNKIEGQFPRWIKTQKELLRLELRNCSIRGTLPWLGSLTNLIELDLSNNHIEGSIPELLSGRLQYLYLSENLINGSIPESLCQMKYLENLDLSKNNLSGRLPDCNWGTLSFAVLSSNHLSGPIPISIGGAHQLGWLRLNNNSFTGQIPSTLKNCTRLSILDLGDNKLSGKLPGWIGNHLLWLGVLRLRNNKFEGDIPSAYCQLSALQIMDLAHNQLTGYIPHCFGNLFGGQSLSFVGDGDMGVSEVMKGAMLEYTYSTSRYLFNLDLSSNRLFGEIPSELTNLTHLNGLNLSHNHLRGTIPRRIGDMKSLESFDLSSNSLSGTIPHSLSKLTSLSFLNLSNNDLSGSIPTGPQLQTLNDHSSYDGNLGLCGDPLPKKCPMNNNGIPEQTRKVENDDGDMIRDKIYLYGFITSGAATGFWGYFGVLFFKRSWRLALFRRMDVLIAKMLGRY